MGEAQVRKIVAGISTTTPTLHWTAEELAGFLGDVPRRRVGQWIDAALVMGTFEWRMATASPTWRSPCMVGAVRLTPSPSGGWTGTLVGNVVPNRALRLALLALAQSSRYPDHAEDDATPAAVAALGDLFAGDVDGKTEVAGRFVPTVLLCQLGPDVDALVAELLAASGLARALTRTQHFALRGTPAELLFPLDADVTQRGNE